MEGNERRESVRISKKNTFQFKKYENGSTSLSAVEGLMLDYSAAGLRFETGEPLEKNTSLFIQLDLDALGNDAVDWRNIWETGDAVSLNVIGSVMWCLANKNESNVFEVGMRFTQKALDQ
jgi:PilZ domain